MGVGWNSKSFYLNTQGNTWSNGGNQCALRTKELFVWGAPLQKVLTFELAWADDELTVRERKLNIFYWPFNL